MFADDLHFAQAGDALPEISLHNADNDAKSMDGLNIAIGITSQRSETSSGTNG